jgi:hypothetical protein
MSRFERQNKGMRNKQAVLERAFRAIEGLNAKPGIATQESVSRAAGMSPPESLQLSTLKQRVSKQLVSGVETEVACRCSKRQFPHVHSQEDRSRAIEAWNRDSRHKVEWTQ